MQGTLLEKRDKAVDQDLIEKLTMAFVSVAKDAYTATAENSREQKAAVQLIMNPRNLAEKMRYAIVQIAVDDSDEELIIAATTCFNVYVRTFAEEVTV